MIYSINDQENPAIDVLVTGEKILASFVPVCV